MMFLDLRKFYENTDRCHSLVYTFCDVLANCAGADRVVPDHLADPSSIQDCGIHHRSCVRIDQGDPDVPVPTDGCKIKKVPPYHREPLLRLLSDLQWINTALRLCLAP